MLKKKVIKKVTKQLQYKNSVIYYIKLKSCPTVRPSRQYLTISAWIDIKFVQNEAPILGKHG